MVGVTTSLQLAGAAVAAVAGAVARRRRRRRGRRERELAGGAAAVAIAGGEREQELAGSIRRCRGRRAGRRAVVLGSYAAGILASAAASYNSNRGRRGVLQTALVTTMNTLTKDTVVKAMARLGQSHAQRLISGANSQQPFEDIFEGQSSDHISMICNDILGLSKDYPSSSSNLIRKAKYDGAMGLLRSGAFSKWNERDFFRYTLYDLVIEEFQFFIKVKGYEDWSSWLISKKSCNDLFGLTRATLRNRKGRSLGNGRLDTFESMRDDTLIPFLSFIEPQAFMPSWSITQNKKWCDQIVKQYLQHLEVCPVLDDDEPPKFISKAVSTHPPGKKNRPQEKRSDEGAPPTLDYWSGAPEGSIESVRTASALVDKLASALLDDAERLHLTMVDTAIALNSPYAGEKMYWAFQK